MMRLHGFPLTSGAIAVRECSAGLSCNNYYAKEFAVGPIYLLADSQPLFWQSNKHAFFQHELQTYSKPSGKAVYIGASNGDVEVYYELFCEAFSYFDTLHWLKPSDRGSAVLLEDADLVFLAGGDVALGWLFIKTVATALVRSHERGAVLMGLSAGAVHLGKYCCHDTVGVVKCFRGLNRVPYTIAAHGEREGWQQAKQIILSRDALPNSMIGLPFGSAVRYCDGTIETLSPEQKGSSRYQSAIHLQAFDGRVVQTQI